MGGGGGGGVIDQRVWWEGGFNQHLTALPAYLRQRLQRIFFIPRLPTGRETRADDWRGPSRPRPLSSSSESSSSRPESSSSSRPELVGTVRLAIGFKQMLCTVVTCYWFLALLWFYKTRSFLSWGGGGGWIYSFNIVYTFLFLLMLFIFLEI